MLFFIVKVLLSALIIAAISEISKRSTHVGGFLAALPLVSVLAILWIHFDGGGPERLSRFSNSVFWLVLPSLAFFPLFSWLVKKLPFTAALLLSLGGMLLLYGVELFFLRRHGISL